MRHPHILWYIADPMCSWCWGFTPVISAIEDTYKDQIQIGLLMGGLRPGNTEPVTPAFRDEILHHWQQVNKLTGQPFTFDGAMPDGFIYDTEPPSRAVLAVGELNPAAMLPYFKSVQHAFYVDGRDVTKHETLAALAQQHDVDAVRFAERFHADDVKKKTQMHFFQNQQAGVTGFPTVVLQDESGAGFLTVGYQPFASLKPKLDTWLAGNVKA